MEKIEDMEIRNNHKNQKTVRTDKTVKTASAIFSESLKSLMPFFANNEKKGSRVKEGEAQTNLQLISYLSQTTVSTSSRKWAHIAAMVAMLLIIGVGDVWGTSNTAIYTVATTTSVTPSGDRPDGSSATFANTYTTTVQQMTGGNSQTLTLKSYGVVLITNITLSMKSNASSGAGKLKYSTDGGSTWTYLVGSEDAGASFSNASWHGSWSSSYVNVSKNVAIVTEEGKDLIIKIEATASSIYCRSYSITYTTDKFTVTYDRGSGTCGTPSQTQARIGEALTLPNAVPPIDCGERGWVFAGWKKSSAQASTTSAPTLLTGTYIPVSNETLYAVYKVTDGVTTYNSNPNCTYDYYYDIMHGNEIEEIQGVYTVPAALSDAEPGESFCSEKHHHFIGWLEEEYINEDGSLKDGAMSHIVPAGETGHTAANKKYYAIWSKIE